MRQSRLSVVAVALGLFISASVANYASASDTAIPHVVEEPILKASSQVTPISPEAMSAFISDAIAKVGSVDNVSALVVDDKTGDVLFSQQSDRAMTPASTLKLITAFGVLRELGLETRFTTRVVQDGNILTLVGGGDPTLVSATPGNWRGKPPGVEQPPSLDQLADLIAQKLVGNPGPFVINVDSTYFSTGKAEETWPKSFVSEGFVSPVTGLTVDFGVDEAGHAYKSPAKFAGEYLAQAITARGFVSSYGEDVEAAPAAVELASVNSATTMDIVERMVTTSNNTMAEYLSHQVGKKHGDDSFAASAKFILQQLLDGGIDTTQVELHDGSGLSASNKVTPKTLIDVIRSAHADGSTVWPLISGLPIAGVSGTLEERFALQDSGRGFVRAKTGTLSGVVSLAGTVTTQSGNVVDFAIMANGIASSSDTEKVVDSLVKRLSECGCS